jgi:hypothetical protein
MQAPVPHRPRTRSFDAAESKKKAKAAGVAETVAAEAEEVDGGC